MRFEAFRIWVLLFIAIFAVSGYTYFKIQENQAQLRNQSYRSLDITKNNLLESWSNYRIRVLNAESNTSQVTAQRESDILETLLNQMPPSNFFDFVMLTDTSGVVKYATGNMPVTAIPDSTVNVRERLGATSTLLTISEEEYIVFQTPVTFDTENLNQKIFSPRLHLIGAVNQENFNRTGRRISFTQLYLLFTLITLLIISFPIIRVVGMGRGDTLLRSHVFQIGLSIVLLAIFIGYSISYLMSRAEIVGDQFETVETLSEDVSLIHHNELCSYVSAIDNYFKEEKSPDYLPLEYNEIFEIGQAGNIQSIRLQGIGELTNLDGLPNLSDRYYFNNAVSDEYLISSHFSYLENGQQEGVISIKKSIEIDGSPSEVVRAITFSFDKLNRLDRESINKIGLKYLLTNPNGDIYYQSPSIETKISNVNNAVEPDQWIQIQALIENNDSLKNDIELPVSFEGQPYIAHLSRLDLKDINTKDPVWVLIFRDQNLRYLRSYATFLYSLAGIGFLVISFGLMALFFVISGRSSHYLNIKQFSYSWFRPSRKKKYNYLFLMGVIGVHLLYYMTLSILGSQNFWFIVFLFAETVACIALYRFILLSSFLKNWNRKRYWIIPSLISATTVGFMLLAYFAGSLSSGKTLLILALIFIQIGGFILIGILNNRDWFNLKNESGHESIPLSTETTYALTFTLWVLLIGMLAGYLIHHSAFHLEDTLWAKAVETEQSTATAESQVPNDLGNIREALLYELEFQRRNWLNNISGLNYPVINRYIYTSRANIYEALSSGSHTEEAEGSKIFSGLFIISLFLIFAAILFILIRILSRQVFLTEYWDFDHKVGTEKTVNSHTYLNTLDKWKGRQFLEKKFLNEKSYSVYDLAGSEIPIKADVETSTNEGFLLLNIEHAIDSIQGLRDFSKFINYCRESSKFVILSGSKSIKELLESPLISENNSAGSQLSKLKWLDSVSNYSTIILPIDYDIPPITEGEFELELDNDLQVRLKQEVRFGPHTAELNELLNKELLENESKQLNVTTYEIFLLTIQRYSKAYYQNIWEKLSFREKQMVYNYSKEGFVNYRNFDVLTELLQKGIFRMDHYREMISLFNQSFTNFATQAPTRSMLAKFKSDKKENGNVTELRNAILTFIFLTILGLSIMAPEVLNRYIGALSGALALISTLASVLNKYTLKLPFMSSGDGQ